MLSCAVAFLYAVVCGYVNPHAETPATEEDAAALNERARTLLAPAETGSEFQKNYFLALQQSPDVVLLDSEMMRLLGRSPAGNEGG